MKKFIYLIIAVLIIWFIADRWYASALSPVDQSKISTAVTIKKGSSTSQIADQLSKAQLIRSPLAFKV